MPTETATPATIATQLGEKIANKTARVGIIGLGYVGLPLAVEFAKAAIEKRPVEVAC